MSIRLRLAMALLAAATGAPPALAEPVPNAGDLPEYRVADPDAAIVTEANLLASEHFWPYQVGLTRVVRVEGRAEPLALGTTGVLIRVEPEGLARIDFGRDGLHELPVAATDLVERANRVRRGEIEKLAPNYVLAMGTRLVDAAVAPPRGYSFREVVERRGFVSVFADPLAPGFAELARSLATLQERPDVFVMLFPQGGHEDPVVYERLRALGWPVPFVHAHLTAPYTRTQLPDDLRPPAVLVQTPEGRLLFRRGWAPGAASELLAAVDTAFPAVTAERRADD